MNTQHLIKMLDIASCSIPEILPSHIHLTEPITVSKYKSKFNDINKYLCYLAERLYYEIICFPFIFIYIKCINIDGTNPLSFSKTVCGFPS